jgi:hypothetical protein
MKVMNYDQQKIVAIVLAVGLLLSIGCVLSQMEVFTTPMLKAQPNSNPSLEQQIAQEGNPNEPIGSKLNKLPFDWNGISPIITRYTLENNIGAVKTQVMMIINPAIMAEINCYGSDGKIVGLVRFVKDDDYDPNVLPSGAEEVAEDKYWNYVIVLNVPYSRYNEIVDVFRNRGEIRLYYSSPQSVGIVSDNIVQNAP